MKINFQYKIVAVMLLVTCQYSFSQKKDENIGTEVVNVVKPYTPTISDAFKVKETPVLDDEETTKKETIQYNIFSFPVASTFVPAKGKAAGVDKEAQEQLYKNYATFGFGNYASIIGELYVTENITDNSYVAGKFLHQSSLSNIKDVELDSKFLDTSLDLTYGSKEESFSWNADLGYQNQVYNWYGLPQDFGSTLTTPEEKQALINSIDPKHTYNNFYLGGKIKFDESVFNHMDLKYNHFSDSYGTAENRYFIAPSFKFTLLNHEMTTDAILDYQGINAQNGYSDGHSILGVAPSMKFQNEDYTLNVGFGLYHSNLDNLLFYPKITAEYNLVTDLMSAYGGLVGGLKQNSYYDFTQINPYLSPNVSITPTDTPYDFYVGLKGKLASFLGYNIKGSLLSEKHKALFKSNDYNENAGNENYEYGNSLSVVYDNVKTFSFFGELKADFSENVAFAINGTFNSYTHDNQPEVWNLPTVKLESHLDVDFSKKWFANAHLFYVGSRKDSQVNTDLVYTTIPVTTLKGYFDANAQIGYRHSERLTGFLKLNNIANQNYVAWMNFPVQRFQALLGANYKFDF